MVQNRLELLELTTEQARTSGSRTSTDISTNSWILLVRRVQGINTTLIKMDDIEGGEGKGRRAEDEGDEDEEEEEDEDEDEEANGSCTQKRRRRPR